MFTAAKNVPHAALKPVFTGRAEPSVDVMTHDLDLGVPSLGLLGRAVLRAIVDHNDLRPGGNVGRGEVREGLRDKVSGVPRGNDHRESSHGLPTAEPDDDLKPDPKKLPVAGWKPRPLDQGWRAEARSGLFGGGCYELVTPTRLFH